MIYAEYIDHDRTLPIQIFQHIGRQSGWVSDVDVKIGNLGRAERIAPEPSVICLWRHPGMARMDEWEASFRTEESQRSPAFQATRLAIHFRRGALYDEIIGGLPLGKGLHYVEFFAAGEDIADEEARDNFSKRAKQYPTGKLDFVLRRVGLPAPIRRGSRSGRSPTMRRPSRSCASVTAAIPCGRGRPGSTTTSRRR